MTKDDRFWAKVKKGKGCWLWTGATQTRKDDRKIGWIGRNGKQMYAARWSWFLENGDIPKGFHVLHKCDNGLCVNPSHLFLGTHADNMRDMAQKGRARNHIMRGENHVNHKLKVKDVIKIRKLLELGVGPTEIAPFFHVSESNIRMIKTRETWKWL